MKKWSLLVGYISFLVLPFMGNSVFAASGTVLKPSLQAQMKLQEVQNVKAGNITRLAELRAQRQSANNNSSVNNTSNRSTVQQANMARLAELRAKKAGGNIQSNPTIILSNQPGIQGVDMNQVRSTWISWYNDYRRSLGLGTYVYDGRLDKTAYSWNIEFAKGKGQNHHRRNPNDAYYDYPKITEWFKEREVIGKVVNRATTTENVGYGYYSCSSSDCTSTLISSIRSTFDFFMSEKSYNGSHYRSIVEPDFTKVGLSVVVEPGEKRYYLVMHFITEFQ